MRGLLGGGEVRGLLGRHQAHVRQVYQLGKEAARVTWGPLSFSTVVPQKIRHSLDQFCCPKMLTTPCVPHWRVTEHISPVKGSDESYSQRLDALVLQQVPGLASGHRLIILEHPVKTPSLSKEKGAGL